MVSEYKILRRRYDLLLRSPSSVLPPYRLGEVGDFDILYLWFDTLTVGNVAVSDDGKRLWDELTMMVACAPRPQPNI
jgi:hypothetical protein